MHKDFDQSSYLYDRSQRFLAGGVNSPSRAFNAVGGHPVFISRGSGPYLYDVDGNRYIDFLCAYGALILGHGHPAVTAAVEAQLPHGTVYGAPTELEARLAELLCRHIPIIDQVRFNASGTEAVMTAIRLARGVTGRRLILKFTGSYHGHSDLVLIAAGSGSSTLGIEDSLGIPPEVKAGVISIPYNNPATLRQAMAERGDEIAAVLVEPVVGNFGIVPPVPGFLELIEELAQASGALVIWDEVITAFRFTYGSVSSLFHLRPDIITLGKLIGGGLPIGAYGARREIMSAVAPLGGVYQDGTFAGNPLSMAAGLACLSALATPGIYERLAGYAARLVAVIKSAAQKHGIPVHVGHFGGAFSVHFTAEPVFDSAACDRADSRTFAEFFHLCLEEGLLIAPSKYEAWFVSAALGEDDVAYTEEALERIFARLNTSRQR